MLCTLLILGNTSLGVEETKQNNKFRVIICKFLWIKLYINIKKCLVLFINQFW